MKRQYRIVRHEEGKESLIYPYVYDDYMSKVEMFTLGLWRKHGVKYERITIKKAEKLNYKVMNQDEVLKT